MFFGIIAIYAATIKSELLVEISSLYWLVTVRLLSADDCAKLSEPIYEPSWFDSLVNWKKLVKTLFPKPRSPLSACTYPALASSNNQLRDIHPVQVGLSSQFELSTAKSPACVRSCWGFAHTSVSKRNCNQTPGVSGVFHGVSKQGPRSFQSWVHPAVLRRAPILPTSMVVRWPNASPKATGSLEWQLQPCSACHTSCDLYRCL